MYADRATPPANSLLFTTIQVHFLIQAIIGAGLSREYQKAHSEIFAINAEGIGSQC